jgi:hypothetical protein
MGRSRASISSRITLVSACLLLARFLGEQRKVSDPHGKNNTIYSNEHML